MTARLRAPGYYRAAAMMVDSLLMTGSFSYWQERPALDTSDIATAVSMA